MAKINHCLKSARIWSFSGPYSVQMPEYTDQKTPNTDIFHAVNTFEEKESKEWWIKLRAEDIL